MNLPWRKSPAGANAEEITSAMIMGEQIRAGGALDASSMTVMKEIPMIKAGVGYALSTGITTFTAKDLADIVASQDDPAIKSPRLKIGHIDPRFDGEPALGKFINLHLTDEGETIMCDCVGVPKWLAGIMASAFPNRSIEGDWDVETVTGKKWRLVVTAVSLLGINWPGVSTLEDLPIIFSEEGPEGVTVDTDLAIAAAHTKVSATATVEDVRREYYETLPANDTWWWIREIFVDPMELIVDDDDGGLYRVSYAVDGDAVTFGDAQEVKVVYQNLPKKAAASLYLQGITDARGSKVVASYDDREKSRSGIAAKEGEGMDPAVLKALGLPEDATQEQVSAALVEKGFPAPTAETPPAPADPNKPDENDEDTQTDETDETAKGDNVVELAAKRGMRVIDEDTYKRLAAGADAGLKLQKKSQEQERDTVLATAVKEGKFPPARKEHYAKMYDADPEGTASLLAGMAPGMVPVSEHGAASGGDEFGEEEAYPASWLPEIAARQSTAGAFQGVGGRGRFLTEDGKGGQI